MDVLPTQLCPTCRLEFPEKHFYLRNAPQDKCRACRNRANNAASTKKRRALLAPLVRAATKQQLRARKAAEQRIKALDRALLSRLNHLCRPSVLALAKMSLLPPTAHREHAMEARRAVIQRYHEAWEAQRRIVAIGLIPKDILHYL